MNPLPRDIARCHDDRCRRRATCLRYLRRHDDGNHVASLRDANGRCAHHMPAWPATIIVTPESGIDPPFDEGRPLDMSDDPTIRTMQDGAWRAVEPQTPDPKEDAK